MECADAAHAPFTQPRADASSATPRHRHRALPRRDESRASDWRLSRAVVPHICDRWGGPFVLSELAEESGVIGAVPEPLEIQAGADAGACTLRRLQLRKREIDLGKPYPINWLRNQGIRCAGTSHYLMVDIDFWPSAELHGLLLNFLPHWTAFNTALVVPNFQARRAREARRTRTGAAVSPRAAASLTGARARSSTGTDAAATKRPNATSG